MLINRAKLRGQVSEKRIKGKDMAKMLGVSRTTYYKKLNGESSFTENEISKLKSIFGEVIFFKDECHQINDN